MRALEPGDAVRVGPFTVLARLGAGAMGAVFLGRSPGGRAVAVKVVHPTLASDAGFRSRFAREVDAARRVGGFWTAAVVDADPDAAQPWLATEYIAGPTLHEAIADAGTLPEPTVASLAAGLAEALAAIHAAGLVHRDVKPSNVILTDSGPRLIDFGIARALDHATVTAAGVVFGTPGYASPEQVSGGSVGPASDVFSLGAVLVHAATGSTPFGAGTRDEILRRTALGRVHLGATPAGLRPLVEACLDTDPDKRPRPADVIAAVARPADPAPGASTWLPERLHAMVAARNAELDALPPRRPYPPTRAYTRIDDRPPPNGAPNPAPPRSSDTPPTAVFQLRRRRAALRAGLYLLGIVLAGNLLDDGPLARLLGTILVLVGMGAEFLILANLVTLPRRLEIGPGGLTVSSRGNEIHLPWPDAARIGVAQARRHPWLVVWPASTSSAQALRARFRAHHGGYRIYRVAPWRSRDAQADETRELRAALGWFAGRRFDPQL